MPMLSTDLPLASKCLWVWRLMSWKAPVNGRAIHSLPSYATRTDANCKSLSLSYSEPAVMRGGFARPPAVHHQLSFCRLSLHQPPSSPIHRLCSWHLVPATSAGYHRDRNTQLELHGRAT